MPGDKRPVKVVTASSFHNLERLKRHKVVEHVAAEAAGSRPGRQHQCRPAFNPLKAPFKTFKAQKEACDFLDKQPCAVILRTFACEVSTSGQRVFIVSSAELFWQHYKALPPAERHHYEIIRQASPCHLYFDLEFCPASNPGLNGAALVVLLLAGVAQQLQQLFSIPWHDSYALELDSSTPSKFSRHLVVRLPGMAFADACHAGRFARLVLLRLLQRGSSQAAGLLVRNKDGDGFSTFVDMGVYTRNRAFRLYLSSKFGKTACLRLTNRFAGATLDPQAAFHQLLISVLHHSSSSSSSSALGPLAAAAAAPAELALRRQQQWRRTAAAAVPGGTRRPVSLLHVPEPKWQQLLQQLPLMWQTVPMLLLNPTPHNSCSSSQQLQDGEHGPMQEQQQQPGGCNGGWGSAGRQLGNRGLHTAAAAGAVVCYGPSPYPLLEQFITSICVQGGVQGAVRSWLRLPGSVVLNMRGNRWCGNVERQHKSNGIYYVVDLREGVFYQKCYDPECRSYRSACMPLPAAVWERYRQHAAADNAHVQVAAAAAATARLAGAAPKPTAAAAAVQGAGTHLQQQQQHQAGMQEAALGAGAHLQQQQAGMQETVLGAGAHLQQQQQQCQAQVPEGGAEEWEDQQCLQLLLQFEEKQCTAVQHVEGDAAAGGGAAGVRRSCLLQEEQVMADGADAADENDELDEYEQCLQLLQEVEGSGWAGDTG
uniref:DNA-directed primase/polymerase protein n=1 Tax=Tetradesmus obliquus TaxID=3088 RepID=A0A383WFI1_TETOB